MTGIKNQEKIDELLAQSPLCFEDAMILIKWGTRMKRASWKDIKFLGIKAPVPEPNDQGKPLEMKKAYIYAAFKDGQPVPYSLQQDDIFSNDWIKA